MARSPAVLNATNVAKAFGATQALRDASLELLPGEVHCIVGENGSGKSTLVKILSGIHRPDDGRIELDGAELAQTGSVRASLESGISTVFQEVLVVEPRSVMENIWLGVDGLFLSDDDEDERRERTTDLLTQLLGTPLPLDAPVEYLSLSQRQTCSIARALVREPRVLILDESTSALDVETRDRLFTVIRELAKRGAATLFISHRMDEIAEIGDRCTVMRSGETVATLDREDATSEELVRLMTGSDHLAPKEAREATAKHEAGDVVMSARGLTLAADSAPIDFELRAGELVGLAGLEGHGQDAFLKALWGLDGSGRVFFGDEPVVSRDDAASHGIGYVPRERRSESILASKSIRENFGISTMDGDRTRGLLDHGKTLARLSTWVDRLSIKLGNPEDSITTLSGGNQQKVIMARWLATEPKVLLLNDPTRGVDIGAKRDLYRLLGDLVSTGVAVVMLSTEVDEHIELMDRVLVFREHGVSSELNRADVSRESLVSAYFGREPAAKPARKRKASRV